MTHTPPTLTQKNQKDISLLQKDSFDIEITEAGGNKIAVIKAVKEALALGLKEAKDLVDGAPSMLKTGMKKEDAAELAKKLTDAGATVTLK